MALSENCGGWPSRRESVFNCFSRKYRLFQKTSSEGRSWAPQLDLPPRHLPTSEKPPLTLGCKSHCQHVASLSHTQNWSLATLSTPAVARGCLKAKLLERLRAIRPAKTEGRSGVQWKRLPRELEGGSRVRWVEKTFGGNELAPWRESSGFGDHQQLTERQSTL